jgi:hypothetical protein
MNVLEKAIRHSHVPFYAFKLLWETVRAWGFRRWLRFWLSSEQKPQLTMDGLTFEVRGASIKSKMTDTFAIMEQLYHKLYNRRFYDDDFRIGENDTVIDIGGYIGSFSIPAARFARRGTVYSFEPSPDNFAQLERNLALNRVTNVKRWPRRIGRSRCSWTT